MAEGMRITIEFRFVSFDNFCTDSHVRLRFGIKSMPHRGLYLFSTRFVFLTKIF